jgi:phosphoglycerate kinase
MNVVAKNKYIEDIEADDMILDLGVESIKIILNEVKKAKTVIWNGPLGAIEYKPFDHLQLLLLKNLQEIVS